MTDETNKLDVRRGSTSASNAEYDSLCEGRHLAQVGMPDVQTVDASFGTKIHEALAFTNPEGLDGDQLSIYESCVEIREKLINDTFGPEASKVERITHRRFWWKSGLVKLEHSGEVDLLVVLGSKGLLIDYKALPGEIEDSPSNLQLRDQASLAAGHLKLTEVDVYIVQPLVTHSPTACRYDSLTIKRSQLDMALRVMRSNNPTAKRTAGSVQCKFCKARFKCKEYSEFIALAVPASMSSLASVPVTMWTPTQRALFCERLPGNMRWAEECKNQIKQMIAKDPEAVPGWQLAPGSIKRPINNPNELHARFLNSGGTTEQFMACVEIGKGRLEKQVREVTQLKGKKLVAKIEEMMAGITDDKQDAPSLEQIK